MKKIKLTLVTALALLVGAADLPLGVQDGAPRFSASCRRRAPSSAGR